MCSIIVGRLLSVFIVEGKQLPRSAKGRLTKFLTYNASLCCTLRSGILAADHEV
jgi:hypothetical protein